MRDLDALLHELSIRQRRKEIIDRLRAETAAAEEVLRGMHERTGEEVRLRKELVEYIYRIGQVLNFLIHDTVRSVDSERDRALCKEVRRTLKSWSAW